MTMPAQITPTVQRLHELAWQAGAWMDAGWWQRLDLTVWHDSYARHPACRRAIDRLIVTRRAFPGAPLPARLDTRQEHLMALEPRLPALATALGLIALSCPDYLLIGRYRRALTPMLDLNDCDQLTALHDNWHAGPATLTPEDVRAAALAAGVGWLAREADTCPVVSGLLGLLPPPVHEAEPANHPDGLASAQLLKLGRFICMPGHFP